MGAPRGWYGEEERIRPVESCALERNRILSLSTGLPLYPRDRLCDHPSPEQRAHARHVRKAEKKPDRV